MVMLITLWVETIKNPFLSGTKLCVYAFIVVKWTGIVVIMDVIQLHI